MIKSNKMATLTYMYTWRKLRKVFKYINKKIAYKTTSILKECWQHTKSMTLNNAIYKYKAQFVINFPRAKSHFKSFLRTYNSHKYQTSLNVTLSAHALSTGYILRLYVFGKPRTFKSKLATDTINIITCFYKLITCY